MKWTRIALTLVLGALILYPLVQAASTATTLFVFNVPVSRAISATYGGSCTSSAFYFNELDANADPDPDGNAARVRPRGTLNNDTPSSIDYNFNDVTNPSTYPIAYYTFPVGVPASGPVTGTEVDTNTYAVIATDDSDINVLKSSSVGVNNAIQTVFQLTTDASRVKDLNLTFIGEVINGTNCQQGTGTKRDLNVYFLNPLTFTWDKMRTATGSGSVTGEKDAQYVEVYFPAWDTNITKYISSTRTLSMMAISASAGGQASCLLTDRIKMTTTQFTSNNDFCQSSTLVPITVLNAGNSDLNVDGNFSAAFTGDDVNLSLKVFAGTATGCGTEGNGLGGWESTCSVATTTDPVTTATCKTFDSSNATTASRLASNLSAGSSFYGCFSGEFNVHVSPGSHTNTFQFGSDGATSGIANLIQDANEYTSDGVLAYPSNTRVGTLLVVNFSSNVTSIPNISDTAGNDWNMVTHEGGTPIGGQNVFNTTFAAISKGGASTVSFDSVPNDMGMQIFEFSGIDTNAVAQVFPAQLATSSTTNAAYPSYTITAPGSRYMLFFTFYDEQTSQTTAPRFTPSAGYTKLTEQFDHVDMQMYNPGQPGGAHSGDAVTLGTASNNWGVSIIAFRER